MGVADFYGRKSNKDDGRSVSQQEADYDSDCDAQGFTRGRKFADPDKSASRFATKIRPDFQELLDHLRTGDCEMLSMWESSRGSREVVEWFTLINLCRQRGILIRIISHARTYDVRVRRDWRTLADDGVDSADESEKISERVIRGKRASATKGLPTARLAFGFRRIYDDRGKFIKQVENPEQAKIVREIFAKYAEGKSGRSIAASLNQRGIPTPARLCPEGCEADHRHYFGSPWTANQVRQIAIKPSYAGQRVHRGQVIGSGLWEPIVGADLWREVNAILSKPGRKSLNDKTLRYWLSGAMFCPECLGKISTWQRAHGQRAYGCRTCFASSAPADDVEAFIEPMILNRLRRPDAKHLFSDSADSGELAEAEHEFKVLADRLAEFRAEGAKPFGLSASAVATAEAGLTPLIEAAKAKVDRATKPSALAAKLKGINVAKEWGTLPVKVRREIVLRLAYIVLGRGTKTGPRVFDPARLAPSRWTGDSRTWGELWAED